MKKLVILTVVAALALAFGATQAAASDLFVGDFDGNKIWKVDTTTGNATVFRNITSPEDLELTQDGHVIAAVCSVSGCGSPSGINAKLVLIVPDGTSQSDITAAGQIQGVEGPALDANGNLYAQSRGNRGIFFLPRTQASPPIFGAPVQVVRGVTLGSAPLPLHNANAAEGMAVLHTGTFAGDILATAPNFGRVDRFSPGIPYTGPFDFAVPGDFPVINNGPFDVKQACNGGDVYITDGQRRLLRYGSDGTGSEVLATAASFSAPPVFIAILPDDIVYFTLLGIGGKLGRYDTISDMLLTPLQIKNADGSLNLNFAPQGLAGPACLRVTAVAIDIKPGIDPNSINPWSKGVIPVAILTTEDFDATTVDPGLVRFGPGEATEKHGVGHIEDVDSDGDGDVVYHFPTEDSGIQCGDTTATLTGTTFGGQPVMGSDSIVTRGCK